MGTPKTLSWLVVLAGIAAEAPRAPTFVLQSAVASGAETRTPA